MSLAPEMATTDWPPEVLDYVPDMSLGHHVALQQRLLLVQLVSVSVVVWAISAARTPPAPKPASAPVEGSRDMERMVEGKSPSWGRRH